jgi:hypothetical protein
MRCRCKQMHVRNQHMCEDRLFMLPLLLLFVTAAHMTAKILFSLSAAAFCTPKGDQHNAVNCTPTALFSALLRLQDSVAANMRPNTCAALFSQLLLHSHKTPATLAVAANCCCWISSPCAQQHAACCWYDARQPRPCHATTAAPVAATHACWHVYAPHLAIMLLLPPQLPSPCSVA